MDITGVCSNPESLQEQKKSYFIQGKRNADNSSWSYDMEGNAKKCVERYCELANRTSQQLDKVATPCLDDQKSVGSTGRGG